MMDAGVSVVIVPPIKSTCVESYNQSDQVVLYEITSAENCCIARKIMIHAGNTILVPMSDSAINAI